MADHKDSNRKTVEVPFKRDKSSIPALRNLSYERAAEMAAFETKSDSQ